MVCQIPEVRYRLPFISTCGYLQSKQGSPGGSLAANGYEKPIYETQISRSLQHCEIAEYADQPGTAEKTWYFFMKLEKRMSESSMKSIKEAPCLIFTFNFRRWARVTKIKLAKNLTND